MEKEVMEAKRISIRDAGFDEYWLQDQIYADPNRLGLGKLIPVDKERQQSSGGRLDIQLRKDGSPITMYEVEVMLGDTDPDHIIRVIEYWDIEKRRYPQREHYAVLVAENITKRFFNVIHLFSHFVPIIAIQVSLFDNGEKYLLDFSTVLNTYEEIDDGSDSKSTKPEDWKNKGNWVFEISNYLCELAKGKLNYTEGYISINLSGINRIWFYYRNEPRANIEFKIQPHLKDQACEVLGKTGIKPGIRGSNYVALTIDKTTIEKNKDVFLELFKLMKDSQDSQ